eukprot:Clim_evm5s43 gene=Clim_evmTU5s43
MPEDEGKKKGGIFSKLLKRKGGKEAAEEGDEPASPPNTPDDALEEQGAHDLDVNSLEEELAAVKESMTDEEEKRPDSQKLSNTSVVDDSSSHEVANTTPEQSDDKRKQIDPSGGKMRLTADQSEAQLSARSAEGTPMVNQNSRRAKDKEAKVSKEEKDRLKQAKKEEKRAEKEKKEAAKQANKTEKKSGLFGIKKNSSTDINSAGTGPTAPVFAVPLAQSIANGGEVGGVPAFLEAAFTFLENSALTETGIYRVSGSATEIRRLRDALDRGGSAKELIEDAELLDHNAVASLIKLFFRELPDQLLVPIQPEIHAVVTCHRHQQKTSQEKQQLLVDADPEEDAAEDYMPLLRTITAHLPAAYAYLLRRLYLHCARILDHEAENSMSAENLAIVFGPNLKMPQDVMFHYLHNARAVFDYDFAPRERPAEETDDELVTMVRGLLPDRMLDEYETLTSTESLFKLQEAGSKHHIMQEEAAVADMQVPGTNVPREDSFAGVSVDDDFDHERRSSRLSKPRTPMRESIPDEPAGDEAGYYDEDGEYHLYSEVGYHDPAGNWHFYHDVGFYDENGDYHFHEEHLKQQDELAAALEPQEEEQHNGSAADHVEEVSPEFQQGGDVPNVDPQGLMEFVNYHEKLQDMLGEHGENQIDIEGEDSADLEKMIPVLKSYLRGLQDMKDQLAKDKMGENKRQADADKEAAMLHNLGVNPKDEDEERIEAMTKEDLAEEFATLKNRQAELTASIEELTGSIFDEHLQVLRTQAAIDAHHSAAATSAPVVPEVTAEVNGEIRDGTAE